MVPDLLTFAKGVNCGYVPLGGVVMTEAVAETFAERVYPGGLTYSGHPLACGAAVGAITAMEDDGVVEHAAHIGDDVLGPGLQQLAASPRVGGGGAGPGLLLRRRARAGSRDARGPGALQRRQGMPPSRWWRC